MSCRAKRVMRQSLFEGEERLTGDAKMLVDAATAHASRILTFALAVGGAALVVALIALTIALLK